MDWRQIIVFLVVLVTALLIGLIYLHMLRIYFLLKIKGDRTMGHVADFHIERTKDPNSQETVGTRRHPIFSFHADGVPVTGMPRYSTSSAHYQIGDEVDITYHRGKPHIFVVSAEIEGKRLWPGLLFFVVFFAALFFFFYKFWDTPRIDDGFICRLILLQFGLFY